MNNTITHSATLPTAQSQRQVALWLLVCCALVFAMVVLGGVTRLTHSGLSIVEWGPIMGAIPPLNLAQWTETFAQYQLTPEYLKVNHGMSLTEFKSIFWLEYYHRLLGRGIGIVFLLPFLYFVIRQRIQRAQIPKFIGMFVFGGLQGALGWYMVKSGLVDNPHVSPYFLTAQTLFKGGHRPFALLDCAGGGVHRVEGNSVVLFIRHIREARRVVESMRGGGGRGGEDRRDDQRGNNGQPEFAMHDFSPVPVGL
jgi:Cytochrome oxidase assembly protein